MTASKIWRTWNIQKDLTWFVRDWLEYTTETWFKFTIHDVSVSYTDGEKTFTMNISNTWTWNMIDVLWANEWACLTGDLVATGLYCDGVTAELNGNILENVQWKSDNFTTWWYCDVYVIDNEYDENSRGFDKYQTWRVIFTRGEEYISAPTCTWYLQNTDPENCTSGEIVLIFSGITDNWLPINIVSWSRDDGETMFDYTWAIIESRVSTTWTHKLVVYNSAWLSWECSVVVGTWILDKDEPTLTGLDWVWYECETWTIILTWDDASCGVSSLTYMWSWIVGDRTHSGYNSITWSQTIPVSVIDSVWHQVDSSVTYTWENIGVQLSSLEIPLWTLQNTITLETWLIELFWAKEWNCGSEKIWVTTWECMNATSTLSEENGDYILTIDPNGDWYCEVIFHDDDGSVATWAVTFGAVLWSCVEDWDNDNFLNEDFWSGWNQKQPKDKRSAIICALYGTWQDDPTAYTKWWSGWDYEEDCSGLDMKMEMVDTLPETLLENKIYVVDTDTVELDHSVNMAECSAIVSKNGATISSIGIQWSWLLFDNNKNHSYQILDNLSINWNNEDNQDENFYWVWIESNNVTMNTVNVYGVNNWIWLWWNNIIINNVNTYNNKTSWLRIVRWWGYITVNNLNSFNNKYWINTLTWENIVFNNVNLFNNSEYWLNLRDISNSSYIEEFYINNLSLYDNKNDVSVINANGVIEYYWWFKLMSETSEDYFVILMREKYNIIIFIWFDGKSKG